MIVAIESDFNISIICNSEMDETKDQMKQQPVSGPPAQLPPPTHSLLQGPPPGLPPFVPGGQFGAPPFGLPPPGFGGAWPGPGQPGWPGGAPPPWTLPPLLAGSIPGAMAAIDEAAVMSKVILIILTNNVKCSLKI